MKIQSLLKFYFSIVKIIIPIFIIIFIFHFVGCNDDTSSEGLTVELKNNETFKYPTVSGDEEGAIIKTQAKHFEISEIKRNSETKFVAVYIYKPKSGFIGTDAVEIEIQKGSDGASEPTEIETVKFNFIVNN